MSVGRHLILALEDWLDCESFGWSKGVGDIKGKSFKRQSKLLDFDDRLWRLMAMFCLFICFYFGIVCADELSTIRTYLNLPFTLIVPLFYNENITINWLFFNYKSLLLIKRNIFWQTQFFHTIKVNGVLNKTLDPIIFNCLDKKKRCFQNSTCRANKTQYF